VAGSKVPCPKCKFALPTSIAVHAITCPICHTVIQLAKTEKPSSEPVVAPPPDPVAPLRSLAKTLFLIVAFVISCWVWVDLEMKKHPPPVFPKIPVLPPRLPEMVTHPDAGPEECARLRASSGACVDSTHLRTCDDAGVVTDEWCGYGAWSCERDGRCGPGARCCIRGAE
jgi:hypothetical protein